MFRHKSFLILSLALLIVSLVVLTTPSAFAQGHYKTLYKFKSIAGGDFPATGVIFDQAGNLYGTTDGGGSGNCADGCGLVYKLTPNVDGSWTKSVLHKFCLTDCADGSYPFAGLVFDQAGNLYGETYEGGNYSYGTVFELTQNADGRWEEKVLHHFTGGADGGLPIGGLIFDQAGNLYGTTYTGTGYGVVFQLLPNADGSWSENVLHTFPLDHRAGGAGPLAGVILDPVGNLYGTTAFGGDISCGAGAGCGIVFQLAPNTHGSWEEKVLRRFTDGAGGGFPGAGLTFDQAGNLYGTTEEGGTLRQCVGIGCGVVFELTLNTDGHWEEKVIHHFTGGADGAAPQGSLIFDKEGNLYGTTGWGGNLKYCKENGEPGGCGVVFKLVPDSNGVWHETGLHRFVHDPGTNAVSGVTLDGTGNVYGTTQGDGMTTFGSVFEITP